MCLQRLRETALLEVGEPDPGPREGNVDLPAPPLERLAGALETLPRLIELTLGKERLALVEEIARLGGCTTVLRADRASGADREQESGNQSASPHSCQAPQK